MLAPRSRPLGLVFTKKHDLERIYKKLKRKCSHNVRQALMHQTGWKFYQAFNTLSELLPNLFYYCKLYWSAVILRRFSKERKRGKSAALSWTLLT